MAFKKSEIKKMNCFRMISRHDPAVDRDASDFKLYDKDPIKNASAIVLKPDESATIFILNFSVKGHERAAIDDAMLSAQGGDGGYVPSYGNWPYTVAKFTLKGIENPPAEKDGIIFKKDGRGYVMDDVIAELQQVGVLYEIFLHWLEYIKATPRGKEKN